MQYFILNKLNYEIIQYGIFTNLQIKISYNSSSIHRMPDAIDYIKHEWAKIQKKNPVLFAGNLAGVTHIQTSNKIIEIDTIHTTYDDFFVSNTNEFLQKFPLEKSPNPLSAGIILVTNDEKIVLGIRNNNTAHQKNTLTIPSGMIDEKDIHDNQIDSFHAIKRESFEETSIPQHNLFDVYCIGLVWNSLYKQTYMPFFGRTNLKSNEIKEKFHAGEFLELVFIPNSVDSINHLGQISDITQPTMEIYKKLFSKLQK
jgi:8-oxo-dGTP pyrophosphatase MutT (NUDIX family)